MAALFTIFCVTRALLKSALLRVNWKGFLYTIDNKYILVYLTKAFVPLLSYSFRIVLQHPRACQYDDVVFFELFDITPTQISYVAPASLTWS